jgi:cytochrome c oxidase subunit 3
LRKGNLKLSQNLLWLTLLAAAIFLTIKYFEWGAKIQHGLFPGMEYYTSLPGGERLFFFLYYFMTGLHAVHVIVGAIFILIVMQKIDSGKVTPGRYILLENSGLYWHLVDLIWIYLFPLFYLIH